MSSASNPFLVSQSFRLLLPQFDQLRYLAMLESKGGQQAQIGEPYPWHGLTRSDLSKDLVHAPNWPPSTPRKAQADDPIHSVPVLSREYPLQRVLLVGQGGTGKTANVHQLVAMRNREAKEMVTPESHGRITLRVSLTEIGDHWQDFVAHLMIPIFKSLRNNLLNAAGYQAGSAEAKVAQQLEDLSSPAQRTKLQSWVDRLRKSGKIELIIDGVDQVGIHSPAANWLENLLSDPDWWKCRIWVAGRPYAIRAWKEILFKSNKPWQILTIDEFDEEQQQAILGKKRWDLIPMEARSLLSNPRALDYIRTRIPEAELATIRSSAELFFKATDHMLIESIANSERGSQLGTLGDAQDSKLPLQASIEQGRRLLAAMAFEMTFGHRLEQTRRQETPTAEPNYRSIAPGYEFEAYIEGVRRRMGMDGSEMDRRYFRRDLDALAALNTWLDEGFLDQQSDQVGGLTQVIWRDRTLQEFWTAVYLCRWSTQQDLDAIGDWLFLPYDNGSHAFEMIWQFVCDMPRRHFHNPDAWLRTIKPLYQPGDGSISGTRRSTEMMYRAWDSLQHYCEAKHRQAIQIRGDFLGEFQKILNGKRGPGAAMHATSLKDSFITVPSHLPFRMGTPLHKQGMPEDQREYWERWLNRNWTVFEDAVQYATGHFQYAPGRIGDYLRQVHRKRLIDFYASRDLNIIEDWFWRKDETPHPAWREPSLSEYQMNAFPTLRDWYALFDPGHGCRGEWFAETLQRVAPTGGHSVFYVSWYDAWAFSQFAHWDGISCRLPHEDEWEKAAKAACKLEHCDWNYWWGDEDSEEHRTCDHELLTGVSTSPLDYQHVAAGTGHKNPLGFIDILGNQWEWTADSYRRVYSRGEASRSDSSSLVRRGGSWLGDSFRIRASVRRDNHPSHVDSGMSFRLARD